MECKIYKLEFTDASQTKVHLDIEVASDAPGGAIMFLFAAVGAEPPQFVARSVGPGHGRLDTIVSIATTRALVDAGQGNKPVSVTAYKCLAYDEDQARRWIMANASDSRNVGGLLLK